MILVAIGVFFVGLFLSAFFSGSETGLYRVTRLKLVLDARAGDRIAEWLLWLVNRPAWFVATALVGNNFANYLTSLGVVTVVDRWTGGQNELAAIIAPVVLSPIVFVYGELLPKHLYFQSPNRLLRRGGRLLITCTILFAPLSGILWAMSKLLERLSGESPEMVKSTLARKELARIFEVGHAAGLLNPSQRQLAQGLFVTAGKPVTDFLVPPQRMPRILVSTPPAQALRIARRSRAAVLLAYPRHDSQRPAGSVRVIAARIAADNGNDRTNKNEPTGANGSGVAKAAVVQGARGTVPASNGPAANGDLPVRPLIRIDASSTQISALEQLHAAGETFAEVVDAADRTLGVTSSWRLREPLFGVSI